MGRAVDEAGQIWETDAQGNPVRKIGGGNAIPIGPRKPAFDLERPQAAATLGKTNAEINAINARTDALNRGTDLAERKFNREVQKIPLNEKDQAYINSMRDQAGGMPELSGKLRTAAGAIDRFQPTPGRGSWYGMTYPESDDWAITSAFKGAGRWFQPDKSERDYETLRAMQESAVLKTQEAQKGPQTEADAARMKASTISPTKSTQTNALLAAEATFNAKMAELKPDFYTKWANSHGSLGALDRQGRSVDQVWSKIYDDAFGKLRKDPRYSRLTGGHSAPPRKHAGGEFLGWED